jgi:diadenosine tetraphosphate (Ap4A) HIT family hydrolase
VPLVAPESESCRACDLLSGVDPDLMVATSEHCIAYVVRRARSRGHMQVSPKRHVPFLTELSDAEVTDLFLNVRAAVKACELGLDPDGVMVLQVNGIAATQRMPHVHVHVRPEYHDQPPLPGPSPDLPEVTRDELRAVAHAIRAAWQ